MTATWLAVASAAMPAAPSPAVPPPAAPQPSATVTVPLPAAAPVAPGSLEDALQRRRSQRSFSSAPLALGDLAQLLWAAQGRTDTQGRRTAPSAGALYPLQLHVVATRVDGLAPGVYRYRPDSHELLRERRPAGGDARRMLAALGAATRQQGWVADAPALVVFSADPRRTAARYGALAPRFVAVELGAAAQNLHLQATARGLSTVFVGSFDEARAGTAMALPDAAKPLALMPLGHPR